MACAFPAPPSLLPQVKLKRYRMPKNFVKTATSKKQFTEEQRKILKAAYNTNYWPSSEFYEDLALTTNLTYHQVKVCRILVKIIKIAPFVRFNVFKKTNENYVGLVPKYQGFEKKKDPNGNQETKKTISEKFINLKTYKM